MASERDADGMNENNRAWLERLMQACEGAADRLRTLGDPAQQPLLEDIQELQARLQRRLDELGH